MSGPVARAVRPLLAAGVLIASGGAAVQRERGLEAAPPRRGRDRADGDGRQLVSEGRQTFRFDTFGDEAFWGGALQLHQAIEGAAHGGVGPGVSPKTALAVGLKVDAEALPAERRRRRIKAGKVNLDDPGDDAGAAQAQRGRRREGHSSTRQRQAQVDRHPVRALPLDGRRLVRARHRQAARRLAEPRPQRRRDRRARAEPHAGRPTCSASTTRPCARCCELGAGQVRRRAVPRRQGLPAGRRAPRRR